MTGGSAVECERRTRRPAAVLMPTHAIDHRGFLPDVRRAVPLRQRLERARTMRARARVAVISADLNDKLFGGANSVGTHAAAATTATCASSACSTPWRPSPQFYDVRGGRFADGEQVLLLPARGRVHAVHRSWRSTTATSSSSPAGAMRRRPGPPAELALRLGAVCGCSWTAPAKVAAYRRFLADYCGAAEGAGPLRAADQHAPAQPDAMAGLQPAWCPSDVRLQTWLAFALPADLPVQHRRPAAGEVPAPQRRDRRAPRAGCQSRARCSRNAWSRPA